MRYESYFFPFYVTLDVVLTFGEDVLQVLLVDLGSTPQLGELALPGGFVQPAEDLEPAALRELQEETGIAPRPRYLEQLASQETEAAEKLKANSTSSDSTASPSPPEPRSNVTVGNATGQSTADGTC